MNCSILKVKQAVDTRWNSVLIMIERLLEIKDPLIIALTNLPSAPEPIEASEWVIISDIVPILKPLELLTVELSGEQYLTISSVIPLIRGLQFHLRNIQPATDIGLWLQSKLLDVISRRFSILESNKIIAKSTFLDPRFKKTAFGLEENARNVQAWITDEVASMIATKTENATQLNLTQAGNDRAPLQKQGNLSLWAHFDSKLAEVAIKSKTKPSIMATLCVRHYLELPHIERSADPLLFWEEHKHMMPELYELHKKYLCVPASSVPSERIFSKSGQITNDSRSRLLPDNLDMILFLNSVL
ncbi:unnamed protein product [Acanthoscelides obtectus]|uniref:HAT C-terminal dimerisation domain-containing protein n=1 Tax=Acanthoscelides obtectus TaxID=200917 RepID=A0A9P0MJ44_ACAOB|nr:unnamed protein product [Acanthoscelides obtectus]CAK1684181.1 Zinc finger BED domain-containing protein 4 [Acanthoscelides obtectus]